jgi:histidinol phosphatase-like PHP family hydrolase
MVSSYPDHHIHTRYSRCCHEQYDLSTIVSKLSSLDFPYYCVSDHIHWQDNDDVYFPEHIKKATELIKGGLEKPIFLGVEITILDNKGTLPNQPNSKDKINYFLVGDHYIPTVPKITMDDIQGSKKILTQLLKKDNGSLDEIMKYNCDMYCNVMKKHHPTILVHPFSTFLRCGFTHTKLLDFFESVCETSQQCQTAIELNRAELNRCYLSEEKILMKSDELLPLPEFYDNLLQVMKKYDVKISFGSDSHQVVDIGDLSIAINTFERFNFLKNRILNFLSEDSCISRFSIS